MIITSKGSSRKRALRRINRFSKTGTRSVFYGYTLVEMIVVVAILGVVVSWFGGSFLKGLRWVMQLNSQSDAVSAIQQAMILIEFDLEEMTRVDACEAERIVFQLDSNRLLGYNPNADPDGDGVPNDFDIDDDGDMTNILGGPVPGTIFNGNDLWDQDDDNDGNIDVQCTYFVSNGELIRDFNFNGGGWGLQRRTVLRNVTGSVFEYFGSLNHTPGPGVESNGDGIITRSEIDALPFGNGNGILDTEGELVYLDSINITLAQDRNGDGTSEFRLRSRIRPPLLSSNRRVL